MMPLPVFAALLLAAAASTAQAAQPLLLHVPSPDWSEQIIYFVMTDRFADGNPRNNDQGAGEYDPKRNERYNGGDLQGIQQRLAYIQGLGATGVWLTPPVRNQWLDPTIDYTGYHGYWAQHFKQVDPHVGTLADYRKLSDALHRRGMVLVQDIVLNHTGNYFDYGPGWSAADPTRAYVQNLRSRPTTAPTQWPFTLNDPRRAADRRAGVYHWTPAIVDSTVPDQELNYQLGNLDDLNTENPLVQRALRDSHGWWIGAVGVDAFRVDTAFYVPPVFFDDFMNSRDARAPGIVEAARRTGRRDFFVFGEGFGIDRAGETAQSARIESYVRGPQGQPLMGGMLNFPLYGAMGDVFARGRPTADLADRIEQMMRLHSRPHHMASFVDNHDVDRFLVGGSHAALQQALLAMLTLPGVPVIYYGTEQGFVEQRGAMFAQGFASGGRDRYDTTAPLYRAIAAMTALRKSNRAFTHGTPQLLASSRAGPGVLAYRMTQAPARDGTGPAAIVVFNTADHDLLVDNLPTGAAAGTLLQARHGLLDMPPDIRAGEGGLVSLRLKPREALVWTIETQRVAAVAPSAATATAAAITLDALPTPSVAGDFVLTGKARGATTLAVVVDGDLSRAVPAAPDAQGRFSARINTSRFADAGVQHRVVAWAEGLATSPALAFSVDLPWSLRADVEDPEGDDRGPTGNYQYPTDASFAPRQMDLRRVRVLGAGGALRIELTMRAITQVWKPQNGFDHVAFSVFIELPGRPADEGATLMPDQNATLPEGMRWHVRLRAHGWSNALFGPRGAGAGPQQDGTPLSPAATISTDAAARTVTFTLPAAALGDPATLQGARVYVTTWDYDGGYRALARDAAPFVMGGAGNEAARDAKVMDASPVITLR